MNKAFIFDMDGVMADSEREWLRIGYNDLLEEYFGQELWKKVPINNGMSIGGIFDAFANAGFQGSYDEFYAKNILLGDKVYSNIKLSEGLEELIDFLSNNNYRLGLVSSSPMSWINQLTANLRNNDHISFKLSVDRDPRFKAKPSPDGYIHAMEILGSSPENTYILEDSAVGIEAGVASGAKVICYTAYHGGVSPTGANYYVKAMSDINSIIVK